ncbi:MAG: glycosyltransferase involved in cell wall biosynthesis [Bacteriovoracaceae bacterium]|jgi:glycosyltransferase involved in cell wall biosynthesis
MSLMPKFSVIIPTFNRAQTLNRAIESVLRQTYKNFELIIVDDGSTDTTQSILNNYPQLKVIKQENQGVSHARNTGVKEARAEWVCFLDSDDEWLEGKLELQEQFLKDHPELNCIHGEEIWIRNGVRVNQKKKHQKGGGSQFLSSVKVCFISPSTVCLTKVVLEEFGGFREDFEVCEDYDLWLKITSKYDIGFIDRPLIKKYGGHVDQLSTKFVGMDYWRIKSIDWILKNRDLCKEMKFETVKILLKKCKILMKGYVKHNNLKNYGEVEKISKYWENF